MPLIYAFTDESGTRHGEPDEGAVLYTFEFTPPSGVFQGARLTMYVGRREGGVGEPWIIVGDKTGHHLTARVEEILLLDTTNGMRFDARAIHTTDG